MKDFDAEQISLGPKSDASGGHQLTASGPVGAFVVHLNSASEHDSWRNTFRHNGILLESARVYKDKGDIDIIAYHSINTR